MVQSSSILPQQIRLLQGSQNPLRADSVLLESLRSSHNVSRQFLKRLFTARKVLYRGKPCPPSFLLNPGEHVMELLSLEDEKSDKESKEPFLAPEIVYEDTDILILNKPAGLHSVSLRHSSKPSVTSWIAQQFPSLSLIGTENGLLHRLDLQTSGLLCFAKSENQYRFLRYLWSGKNTGHCIRKTYRAWVTPPKAGPRLPSLPRVIDWPMGASRKTSKRMLTFRRGTYTVGELKGKLQNCVTLIERLHPQENPSLLDLQLSLVGGRRHQIRCHLAGAGMPVLGDTLYGKTASSRMWLHAWKLEIPVYNKTVRVEAPLPVNWNNPT